MSSKAFLEAVKSRRSYHTLSNKSPITDNRVEEIVKHAALYCPSTFNCQGTRCVVLLKREHEKFWDLAYENKKACVPPHPFNNVFVPRIKLFRGAYGTVLFYEDSKKVEELQAKHPLVADYFPQWSEHSNAMHQYIVWTALEQEGLGCNLQHYNPSIDADVAAQWNIPTHWKLKAQLVFGAPAAPPNAKKTFDPVESRVFVYGKERRL